MTKIAAIRGGWLRSIIVMTFLARSTVGTDDPPFRRVGLGLMAAPASGSRPGVPGPAGSVPKNDLGICEIIKRRMAEVALGERADRLWGSASAILRFRPFHHRGGTAYHQQDRDDANPIKGTEKNGPSISELWLRASCFVCFQHLILAAGFFCPHCRAAISPSAPQSIC